MIEVAAIVFLFEMTLLRLWKSRVPLGQFKMFTTPFDDLSFH